MRRISKPEFHPSAALHIVWTLLGIAMFPLTFTLNTLSALTHRVIDPFLAPKTSSPAVHSTSYSSPGVLETIQALESNTEFVVVGKPTNRLLIVIPGFNVSTLAEFLGDLSTGNPGFPQMYVDFMQELHRLSNGRLWCVSMGHLGHRAGLTGRDVFTLQQQITHKAHIVNALLKQYPDTHVFLAGHSVGAHMCCQVMHDVPHHRVLGLLALCPTLLHIGTTPNGKRLYPLMRFPLVRKSLAHIVDVVFRLPRSIRSVLVRPFASSVPQHMFDTLHDQIDGSVIDNVLYMARHEMEEIMDLDEEHMTKLQHKLMCVFAHEDGWATEDHEADLLAACQPAHVWKSEPQDNVAHAFVLTASETVARRAMEFLALHLETPS